MNPQTIEKVSNLLLSVQDENSKVAFSILENQEFPKILLTEIFAIFKLTDDEPLKQTAKEIIIKNGSEAVQKQLKSKLSLGLSNKLNPPTEKTIKKNILTYVKDNELDGLKLAQALYQKYGLGVAYMLEESPKDQQVKMFKTFLNGTVLKLQDKALTKFPEAIFQFPELTEIDLSNNKIVTLPAEIELFKDLKILNLSNNNLKRVHNNITKLTTLIDLDLSGNRLPDSMTDQLYDLPNVEACKIRY